MIYVESERRRQAEQFKQALAMVQTRITRKDICQNCSHYCPHCRMCSTKGMIVNWDDLSCTQFQKEQNA